MNSNIAIRVEGLGKKYVIGRQSAGRGETLRDTIARRAGVMARAGRAILGGAPLAAGDRVEDFWALKGVDFEISKGDVVGVIGRNGAGKSTLLKVLSRIIEPTSGRVLINGRVASLLEVGTGFHPELTGRENIFLNGAILGMARSEIHRKFDEIVAFSEVEKFLDTPVKRYSSGMYVRLAFAVAAHLEPEILVVDEVLAVGDAEFQKRCLGKMKDVASSGQTVLFVSHNIAAINYLCTSAILLENGAVSYSGPARTAVDIYLKKTTESSGSAYRRKAGDANAPAIHSIDVFQPHSAQELRVQTPLLVDVAFDGAGARNLVISLLIYNEHEVLVAHTSTEVSQLAHTMSSGVRQTLQAIIPGCTLNAGRYHCDIVLAERNKCFHESLERVVSFQLSDPDFSFSGTSAMEWKGVLSPRSIYWRCERPEQPGAISHSV